MKTLSFTRIAAIAAITIVLAVTFAAYLQPDFVFDIANRIALCF